jgi:hypothetical protein
MIAFNISSTYNHIYTIHKSFMWKPKWEKTIQTFLIYILNITSTGSTNFQTSPAPTGRRHQPPIYRLQPEGSYNSLNSPNPTGRRTPTP